MPKIHRGGWVSDNGQITDQSEPGPAVEPEDEAEAWAEVNAELSPPAAPRKRARKSGG